MEFNVEYRKSKVQLKRNFIASLYRMILALSLIGLGIHSNGVVVIL